MACQRREGHEVTVDEGGGVDEARQAVEQGFARGSNSGSDQQRIKVCRPSAPVSLHCRYRTASSLRKGGIPWPVSRGTGVVVHGYWRQDQGQAKTGAAGSLAEMISVKRARLSSARDATSTRLPRNAARSVNSDTGKRCRLILAHPDQSMACDDVIDREYRLLREQTWPALG